MISIRCLLGGERVLKHRADFQVRAIGQLPALVGITENICIVHLIAVTIADFKHKEPGEPVAVGVQLALALAAGEVLLVVKAEDVGLGEGVIKAININKQTNK